MPVKDRSAKAWWVYVIEADNARLYTGISTDVARRLREHLAGRGARSLRGASQLTLKWQVEMASHSEALRVERRITALPVLAKHELISCVRERRDVLARFEDCNT